MKEHRSGHVIVLEKECWELIVSADEKEPETIDCLCSSRNHIVPWTRRYDDALPAEEDNVDFPFCPSMDWQNRAVTVWKTYGGHPSWVDRHGKYWAKPNTPGETYHWDVSLEGTGLQEEYGVPYLNIVRWGAPSMEGAPGSIHHKRRKMKHLFKKETGWKC